MGAGLAGVAGQERQQLELLRRQLDGLTFDRSLVVHEVEHDRAHCELAVVGDDGLSGMAESGADPRFQLGHTEGFGHIIVGARVQGRHFAVLQSRGRKHDHRHLGPRADAADHFEAVEVGQPEVEHHHVGGAQGQAGQAFLRGARPRAPHAPWPIGPPAGPAARPCRRRWPGPGPCLSGPRPRWGG